MKDSYVLKTNAKVEMNDNNAKHYGDDMGYDTYAICPRCGIAWEYLHQGPGSYELVTSGGVEANLTVLDGKPDKWFSPGDPDPVKNMYITVWSCTCGQPIKVNTSIDLNTDERLGEFEMDVDTITGIFITK